MKATIGAAIGAGLRGTARAWRIVALVSVLNLALAGVLAPVVHGALASSFGSTLAGERMRDGFDPFWFNSFASQATGVASTFKPSVSGKGAVYDAVDLFVDGFRGLIGGPSAGILPLAFIYIVLWSVLAGGFIARWTDTEPRAPFPASVGRHASGMLALTVVGLALAYGVFGPLRASIGERLDGLLREEVDERVRFAWTVGQYAAMWIVLWVARVVLDFAKVGVVRRTGRSALLAVPGALWRAMRLVLRHPVRTLGLHLVLGVIWLLTTVGYAMTVPGAETATTGAVLGTFLYGQAYIASRVVLRVLFLGSTTALAQALTDPPAGAPVLTPAVPVSAGA